MPSSLPSESFVINLSLRALCAEGCPFPLQEGRCHGYSLSSSSVATSHPPARFSGEMGNEHSSSSSPPQKKCSHSSLDNYRPDKRNRSSSGTPQLLAPRIEEHLPVSADCTPRLERRPSCRNKLSVDNISEGMGANSSSRRNSRRGCTVAVEGTRAAGNDSLAEAAKLSQYQCSLVGQTWPRIKANHAVFTQAFKMLTYKSPTARQIFQKMSIVEGFKGKSTCDLNAHLRYLTELIDVLVADLNQPAAQAHARCLEVGAAHFGMTEKCVGNVWEQLGENLAEAITRADCVRQKREAVKGWNSLVSYIVDVMKNGYVTEYRKRHARPSIGHIEIPAAQQAYLQQAAAVAAGEL